MGGGELVHTEKGSVGEWGIGLFEMKTRFVVAAFFGVMAPVWAQPAETPPQTGDGGTAAGVPFHLGVVPAAGGDVVQQTAPPFRMGGLPAGGVVNLPFGGGLGDGKLLAGNPVIPGWYADPEGAVFGGTYWIYPTFSAPYDQQTLISAFSSPDLVHWTKHFDVVDTNAITWAKRAMWAPAIVHKDGKYFLFFGANDIQNSGEEGGIGVAVADSPAGPFKDYLGKPLINQIVNRAQPIDQFVFQDKDGQWYMIYGGWGRCNIVRLKDDFTGTLPLRRWHDLPRDYAPGLHRGAGDVYAQREVLFHVVGRRLDWPQLSRGVWHGRFALWPLRAHWNGAETRPGDCDGGGTSWHHPRAGDGQLVHRVSPSPAGRNRRQQPRHLHRQNDLRCQRLDRARQNYH